MIKLEQEFTAQTTQQKQQLEKVHVSELEKQRQELLAEQRELKERSEREVEDVKTKAGVEVAQALANQKVAVEAATETEATLRAELATAQEATEKVRHSTVVLAAE